MTIVILQRINGRKWKDGVNGTGMTGCGNKIPFLPLTTLILVLQVSSTLVVIRRLTGMMKLESEKTKGTVG